MAAASSYRFFRTKFFVLLRKGKKSDTKCFEGVLEATCLEV
ncbi:hypothetical protein GGP93_003135 [Salinibacter ruber]|nr:hypothetical protein [Salinibacter ruber]